MHNGPVNGLINFGDCFVSGCKEYLLRTWDYEANCEKLPEVKVDGILNAIKGTFRIKYR